MPDVVVTLPPTQVVIPVATIRRARQLIGDMDGETWEDDEVGQSLVDHVYTDGLGVVNYDLYGAAADLLEAEQVKFSLRFDVTDASGASMKRSQTYTARADLIKKYRAQQRAVSVSSVRSDVPIL